MTAQAVVGLVVIAGGIALVALIASAVRVIKQYERGVHFRLGRVIAVREPGLRLILPIIDRLWRVSMRIVTMPNESQGSRLSPSPKRAALSWSGKEVQPEGLKSLRAVPRSFSSSSRERSGFTSDWLASPLTRSASTAATTDEAVPRPGQPFSQATRGRSPSCRTAVSSM